MIFAARKYVSSPPGRISEGLERFPLRIALGEGSFKELLACLSPQFERFFHTDLTCATKISASPCDMIHFSTLYPFANLNHSEEPSPMFFNTFLFCKKIISLKHLYATHIAGVILEHSPMFESFQVLDTIPGVN